MKDGMTFAKEYYCQNVPERELRLVISPMGQSSDTDSIVAVMVNDVKEGATDGMWFDLNRKDAEIIGSFLLALCEAYDAIHPADE